MIVGRRGFIGALLATPLVACLPEPVPASLDIGPMFFDGKRGDPFGGRLKRKREVSNYQFDWIELGEWRGNVYLPPMEIGR